MQRLLRQGANDPQIQQAEDLQRTIAQNQALPAWANTSTTIPIEQSLAVFVIQYDETGHPLQATGKLHGTIPTPPKGVFDYVRTHNEERLTWAPEANVRIATVIRHIAGTQSGFILVGRSLREVEIRESQLGQIFFVGWLVALSAILIVIGVQHRNSEKIKSRVKTEGFAHRDPSPHLHHSFRGSLLLCVLKFA